ncbi:MAG: sel1 repeat family protein [Methylobacteriaceae bacterium]|jgi:hypothetical protein|nr:sel1 repeat family protein [Methylobacteriaceae bacterium]
MAKTRETFGLLTDIVLSVILLFCAPASMVRAQTPSPAATPPSFEETVKSAETGDADAMLRLGGMYEHGRGVGKDDTEAQWWYHWAFRQREKAAGQGDVQAQYDVGLMYLSGKGVRRDTLTAVDWFTKAGEKGLVDAQFQLGRMYCNGVGVPRDLAKGAKWSKMAAEQGDARGRHTLETACLYQGVSTVPDETLMRIRRALFWVFAVGLFFFVVWSYKTPCAASGENPMPAESGGTAAVGATAAQTLSRSHSGRISTGSLFILISSLFFLCCFIITSPFNPVGVVCFYSAVFGLIVIWPKGFAFRIIGGVILAAIVLITAVAVLFIWMLSNIGCINC